MILNEANLILENFNLLEQLEDVVDDINENKFKQAKEKIIKKINKFFIKNKSRVNKTQTQKKLLIKKIEDELNNTGLNTKEIEKIVDNTIKKNENKTKQLLLKRDIKGIKIHTKEIANDIKVSVREMISRTFETDPENRFGVGYVKSAMLLSLLFYVSKILSSLFFIMVGPAGLPIYTFYILLTIFETVIVAPILEEFLKMHSIKHKYGKQFFILFNTIEFTGYVSMMTSMGVNLFTAVIIRIAAVLMHLVTTLIQGRYAAKADKSDDEIHKKFERTKGFVLGTFIHGLWNANAVFASL